MEKNYLYFVFSKNTQILKRFIIICKCYTPDDLYNCLFYKMDTNYYKIQPYCKDFIVKTIFKTQQSKYIGPTARGIGYQ